MSNHDRTSHSWTRVRDHLPRLKELVETNTDSGQIQDLILHRGLWWLPDMSMYVYYVPTMWRYKNG